MDTTQVATKADIKRLEQSTKVNVNSLKQEILKVEERVENIEEGQKRLETKIDNVEEYLGAKLDKIMNTLDGFVGRVDNLTTDNEIGAHQTRELRLQVDNLKKRLNNIESSKRTA